MINILYHSIIAINDRIKKECCFTEVDEKHKNELRYMIALEKQLKSGSATSLDQISNDEITKYFREKGSQDTLSYFHYTDLNGLLGIFDHYIKYDKYKVKSFVTRCTMRASQLRFLNDSEEYVEGKKYYENFKIEFKKQLAEYIGGTTVPDNKYGAIKSLIKSGEDGKDGNQDIYSISFCGDGDLLSQWKYYGKNSGIAIEFDFNEAKFVIGDLREDISLCGELDEYAFEVSPLKVAYTKDEKVRLFARSSLIRNLIDGKLTVQEPLGDIFIPYCKNEQFKEEKESRMVFQPCNFCQDYVKKPIVGYTVSEGKIKPFIPITFFKENGNIIKSITVGPGINQNLIYNALIHIFHPEEFCFEEGIIEKESKQNKIKIKKSEIPFRG